MTSKTSNMSCDEKTANLLAKQAEMYEVQMNSNDTSKLLTNFLQETASALSCGADCQDTKQSNKLLAKYQKAQMDLFTGPDRLESTADEYYTFSKGEEYASQFAEEKIGQVADRIAREYQNTFDDIAQTSRTLNDLYESNMKNLDNSKTLEDEYSSQTINLERELADTANEATTSDRKTFYEDQEMQSLVTWNKVYSNIYLLILLAFLVSAFLVETTTPFRHIVIIFVILVLWYFTGHRIFVSVMNFIKRLSSMGPKNVYLGF